MVELAESIENFKTFHKLLSDKDIKQLSDSDLRREIIYFFDTTSWKKIYEIRRTLLALEIVKENRDGYTVL